MFRFSGIIPVIEKGKDNEDNDGHSSEHDRDELFQGAVLRINSLFHLELVTLTWLDGGRIRTRQYVSVGIVIRG